MRGGTGWVGVGALRMTLPIVSALQDTRTVVNFDAAMRIETHVHRCGRTGRMGVDGTDIGDAHTLVTHKEFNFAADLVNNLRVSGQVRTLPRSLRNHRGRPKLTPSLRVFGLA